MNQVQQLTHKQRAAQELLYRRNVRDSLLKFREHMTHTGSTEFRNEPARHHKLIIEHLEQLERGEIRRLLILADGPPDSWRFGRVDCRLRRSTLLVTRVPILRFDLEQE